MGTSRAAQEKPKSFDVAWHNTEWEVWTDSGWQDFDAILEGTADITVAITLSDGFVLRCTPDHKLFNAQGIVRAQELQPGDKVVGELGLATVLRVAAIEGTSTIYDLLDVKGGNKWYSGPILSRQCIYLDEFAHIPPKLADEFYTSVLPTISSGDTTKIIITSCVSGDTLVYTPQGLRTMRSYVDESKPRSPVIGYEVEKFSVRGFDQVYSGNVIVNSGMSDIHKITASHSEIKCSPNHKLYSYANGSYRWRESKDLQAGDLIAIRYGMNVWGDRDTFDYVDDTVSDARSTNHFQFDGTITRQLAYAMGMIVGDGSIHDGANLKSVTITSEDCLKYVFNDIGLSFVKYDDLRHQCNSTSFVAFLKAFGFDPNLKSRVKVVPQRILELKEELVAAFLSGLFDADGTIFNTPVNRVSYTSTSETMVDQVRALLLNFGILSLKREAISEPNALVTSRSVAWILDIEGENYNLFNDLIGFSIPRKHERTLIQHVSKRLGTRSDVIPNGRTLLKQIGAKARFVTESVSRQQMLKNDPTGRLREVVSSDVIWSRIKSNEVLPEQQEVFDFSLDHIDGNKWCHSVLYNGIVGHQTPKGMNLFFKLWNDSVNKKNDYKRVSIHYSETPGRDEVWAEAQRRAIGDVRFEQEFGCVSGDTVVTVRDPETKEEYSLTIAEIYDWYDCE